MPVAYGENAQGGGPAGRLQRRSGEVLHLLPKSSAGPAAARKEDGLAAARRTVLRRCSRMSAHVLRLHASRYLVVGLLNTLVGLLVIIALQALLGFSPVVANACGYATGLAASFIANRSWTFRHSGSIGRSAALYAAMFALLFVESRRALAGAACAGLVCCACAAGRHGHLHFLLLRRPQDGGLRARLNVPRQTRYSHGMSTAMRGVKTPLSYSMSGLLAAKSC